MLSVILNIIRFIIIITMIYFTFSINEVGTLLFPDRYFIIIFGIIGSFFGGISSFSKIWISVISALTIVLFWFSVHIIDIPFFTPILNGKHVEVTKDAVCYKGSICHETRSEAYCMYDYYHRSHEAISYEFMSIPDTNCIFTGSTTEIDKKLIEIHKGDMLGVSKVSIEVEDFGDNVNLVLDNGIPYNYNSEFFETRTPVFNKFIRYITSYRH